MLIEAYEKLARWAAAEGLPTGDGRLSGASRDNPEVTPLARCRYEFRLEIPPGVKPPDGIGVVTRSAGDWARHHVRGDMKAVDRAWNVMFKSWLPAAGRQLRNEAAEELYRRVPRRVKRAKRFDLWCCVPLE